MLKSLTGMGNIDAWYDAWKKWRLAGSKPADRPTNAPKFIPPAAWKRLKSEMRVMDKAVPHDKRVAFSVAWSTRPPDVICRDIKTWGGTDVWVQNNAAQADRAPEWRVAATQYGLRLLIWEWAVSVDHAVQGIKRFNADGFIANVEHVGVNWAGYTKGLREAYPYLWMGVWTTYWGVAADNDHPNYSPEVAKPWVAAKFACIPECYIVNEQGPQPQLNPDNMAKIAYSVGFKEVVPSFGIYRTGPESYAQYIKPKGNWDSYSWYLYEYYPGGA